MSFFADPSFFELLAVVVAIAAGIGLTGHSLRRYGLVVSLVFLCLMFYTTPLTGAFAACFMVVALAVEQFLLRKPDSKARYRVALVLSLTPLVAYKVGAVWGANILGFSGISYVTFRAVQVVIETHGGLIKELSVPDELYFLAFFPTFTSGPIDRSRRFVDDAHKVWKRDEYAGMLARGLLLLLAGMIYKLVLATLVHRYYAPAAWSDTTGFWYQVQTAYQYALYLFFDFAGYSLMAMGVSYCLGIRTPRNFRAPFVSTSIDDFWNRWHISLSTWLRDFVFMRVTRDLMRKKLIHGKNRRLRTAQIGFLCNMVLMGAWHGLTPDYLIYGLYHGVLMGLAEAYHKKSKFYKAHKDQNWYKVASWFVTMQLVVFSFAIFSGQISMLVKGALNG